MIKTSPSSRGFTLVELVVVLTIVSILTVIAAQTFGAVKHKGKLKRVEIALMEMEDALSKYAQEHGGKYPALKRFHFPEPQVGDIIIHMGPAIIGGNGGPANEPNVFNQDDYLDDVKLPDSPYRLLPGQNPTGGGGPRQKLKPIDELYRENLYRYIDNPLASPGNAMVNVAFILYDHNIQTNDFIWVNDIAGPSFNYDGLAPGMPEPGGFYRILDPWLPHDSSTWFNYPAGNFAYIPLSLTTEKANYTEGYWLIGYGDENTLANSTYNELLRNPNWPNFDPPFGDGDPDTPPAPESFEETVRIFIAGALVVRANVYQDQLTGMIDMWE